MKTKKNLLAVFLLPLLCCTAWAATPVRVVGVSDGDTIRVVADGKQIKIRLHGIDAPEKGQDFGKVSTKGLRSLLSGRQVSFEPTDTDRYERTVALIFADGVNVNRAMVSNGWAWVFTKYCTQSFCAEWKREEQAASTARKGLWLDSSPIAPWEWRARQRALQKQEAPLLGSNAMYSGNVKSGVFHRSTCKHFACRNCMKTFKDRQDAIDSGYHPCGACKP